MSPLRPALSRSFSPDENRRAPLWTAVGSGCTNARTIYAGRNGWARQT